jgi:AcrR family transcriptional regulator
MTTKEFELDPRIERTRRVVLDAAAELIGECGFGRASIEAISERSGVARSTIYRHWPERSELLLQAVGHKHEPIVMSVTGDLRTDLVVVYSHLGNFLTGETTGTLAASFIAEARRDPELAPLFRKLTESRRSFVVEMIRSAIAAGELPEGINADEMADDMEAPLFFRAMVLDRPIDEEWVESHIDRWIGIYRST